MKLDGVDLEYDDFRTINTRERFDRHLSTDDVRLSIDLPIVVRYDYVDLGKTDYHFHQHFTHEDTMGYFAKMKYFAGKSINQIFEQTAKEDHFHRSEMKGNVAKAVKAILPKAVMTDQIIYHFGLYDTHEWADRDSGKRNPRVYIMVGTYGQVYILFFDPYHELNPLPRQ